LHLFGKAVHRFAIPASLAAAERWSRGRELTSAGQSEKSWRAIAAAAPN